jgi:hypothetical protein
MKGHGVCNTSQTSQHHEQQGLIRNVNTGFFATTGAFFTGSCYFLKRQVKIEPFVQFSSSLFSSSKGIFAPQRHIQPEWSLSARSNHKKGRRAKCPFLCVQDASCHADHMIRTICVNRGAGSIAARFKCERAYASGRCSFQNALPARLESVRTACSRS